MFFLYLVAYFPKQAYKNFRGKLHWKMLKAQLLPFLFFKKQSKKKMSEKMTIFIKKNGIFIFLKNTNKKEGQKKIIASDTFFIFLLCFFFKKKKRQKLGKNWAKKLGLYHPSITFLITTLFTMFSQYSIFVMSPPFPPIYHFFFLNVHTRKKRWGI
jgi:hypothetical protein